ncbi:MAG TPA: sugar phosphate isomerase/epimerase family protein [Opitutus sp.]|nr:sugar phosphate isomerase/epimerase family protein [Opitutus sp.]
MRLGIGSYTYVWAVGVPGYPPPAQPLGASGLLEKAAALDLRVVQIADNLPLHRMTEAELERLRREGEERAIELEIGTSGIEGENLRRHLEIARKLRARFVRTMTDTATARPTPDEVVVRLSPLMAEFERAGVTVGLENHDRFSAVVLRDIIERVGSPALGICLDTANSLGCLEGPDHVVETLGPLTVNVHLKDVRAFRPPHHKGFVIEGRPAGQGQIDFRRVLQRLREVGAKGNAIVELWPAPEPNVENVVTKEDAWARESVAHLRPLVEN